MVLELTSEQSIVAYCIRYDGDDVGIADGVGVVGEGEILAYYCGGVDIWWNCYVDGVDYCPLDLLARVAMYDGAGVVVVGGSGCVACWLGCWSGEDEVKCDECSDGSDGGGDILIGHD